MSKINISLNKKEYNRQKINPEIIEQFSKLGIEFIDNSNFKDNDLESIILKELIKFFHRGHKKIKLPFQAYEKLKNKTLSDGTHLIDFLMKFRLSHFLGQPEE